VTAYDRAGNAARASFSIVPDSAAPTGASVAVTGGPWFTSTVVPVQATAGSDAGSGVDPGSLVVERDYAPLEGEDEGGGKGDERRCGEFRGHWTRVKLVDNTDPTATQPGCYRYRIRVSDNVGNKSKSEPSEPVTIPRRD
jgi:hypothetical protein